ncbi:MAG: AAA family ATPase [Acutalibacteraceae bacterium]
MSQKKIVLSFDSSWVLSKRDEAVLPVEAFLSALNEIIRIDILEASLTDCEFVVKDDALDSEAVEAVVSDVLHNKFELDKQSGVFELSVTDFVDEKPPLSQSRSTPPESEPAKDTANDLKSESAISESTINRINGLIGAEEFKALADECVCIAPGIKKHNTFEAFTHQCYIFAINDGNGLTTYLNLFADLLSELGLFTFKGKERVVEEKILPYHGKDSLSDPFSAVMPHFQRYSSNKGKIICIDISEWMTKTNDKMFRDFLSVVDDHTGENIIVFRVPFVEKEILFGLKQSLGDILFVRDVSFIPFDNIELVRCAEELLAEWNFSMEDNAWDIFNARIAEEKKDGRFYGINTVKKVVREMIYRKQLDNAHQGIDDTIIKKSEITGLAASFEECEKDGLQLLDDFVGMESVKERVEEIVAQIEMSLKNSKLGAPCIHMRFVGNPGTGKTTVARVIGKILKEKGILRNGSFFEYSGRDLCGRYVGETAPKTAAMCRDAYGSVMFIDEAYSLYRGDGQSNVDYGREAIDTLVAEMENHRSDLVVIMAGYPDDMDKLMKSNLGLESRMPYVIEFPNYTRSQLYQIFMRMVKSNFTVGEDFDGAVKEYFDSLPDDVIDSKEFSNARFVRNLFERTWGKMVLRAQLNKCDYSSLTKEDFIVASSEKEFKKIMQKQSRTLGFA